MKKTILSMILLAAGCFSASAQEATEKEVFNPHWYVGGQVGIQHTLGEISSSSLNSFNFNVFGGYQFTSLWGLRLSLGGYQSKGGVTVFPSNPEKTQELGYKWNYIAPALDATFNVTNAIGGYNPKRLVDVNLLAGVAMNIAWNNKEAADVRSEVLSTYYKNLVDDVQYMDYLWDGTKVRAVGRLGVGVDFKVCKRVKVGLEANANFLSEHYNSKNSGNVDWYFNGLVGVKVALGKISKKAAVAPVPVQTKYVDKIVTVHDTIYVQVPADNSKSVSESAKIEPIRRDIFFTIANSTVSKTEMPKVEDLVEYLNKYPNSKISVTGYADKGTGSAQANLRYAQRRAQIVADLLVTKFGISRDRIKVDSKGDKEQPFKENELNRVSICIAE